MKIGGVASCWRPFKKFNFSNLLVYRSLVRQDVGDPRPGACGGNNPGHRDGQALRHPHLDIATGML